MLEEGEKEGAVRLFIVKIKGREMALVELTTTLDPVIVQLIPEGSEQPAPLTPN